MPTSLRLMILSSGLFGISPALMASAIAAETQATIADCHGVQDDIKRLACYDTATGKTSSQLAPSETKTEAAAGPIARAEAKDATVKGTGLRLLANIQAPDAPGSHASTWSERWDLDDQPDPALFALRPYKPMYVLLANHTTSINTQPSSPNPANTSTNSLSLQNTEAKYQISFKVKALDTLFVHSGAVWFGYTQSSRWQIYNPKVSAAFRETDYEPEVMATVPVDYSLFGWKASMLGLSFTHQSNGRDLPTSRSWNRLIGEAAFERPDWTLVVRPWVRLHERNHDDDNRDITDYVGRGELLLIHTMGKYQLSLTARHSLKGGERSRGSLEADWAFPLYGYLKGHVQLFSGYGESLIDYNHKQTTFGFGVSLLEWL